MWWHTLSPLDILFKAFRFDFLIKIQLHFQPYNSTRHEEHFNISRWWMQCINILSSYKHCIVYNSKLPTYSLQILLLWVTQFICTTYHSLMATICLKNLYCLGEIILLGEGNIQQLKHICVTVLTKLTREFIWYNKYKHCKEITIY